MATTDTKDPVEWMRAAIEQGIKRAAEEEFEVMKKRLDERKSEIVSSVMLHVKKHIDIQRMSETMVVSVRLEK